MAVFEPVIKTLNDASVRYVVVGGLAVVLHGHARLTADIDLIVDLRAGEALKAIDALVRMGFRPRVPVDPRDFANGRVRESWQRERGMQVFSMFDPTSPMRVVDLFVHHPIPFEELWSRSIELDLAHTTIRVASIADLIHLKRLAGRPQDLLDIQRLEAIVKARQERGDG
jgi:predicted nucleotidyltransferase